MVKPDKSVNKRKEWEEVAEVPSNIAKNDDNADTINPFFAATAAKSTGNGL
jgi:hypothetical protein